MLYAVSTALPLWLHEGFAKYVGALDLDEDLVVFDQAAIHGGYAFFAEPVPLRHLLSARGHDFHGAGELAHYMTAWFLLRLVLGRHGGEPAQKLKSLVDAVASATTPAEVASALERGAGLSLDAIDAAIRDAHGRVVAGSYEYASRTTLAKRLVRGPRAHPRVTAANRAEVKELCAQLRRRQRR